ncbi:hypothetical protein ACN47E_006473 [Coniothyrium glycines]
MDNAAAVKSDPISMIEASVRMLGAEPNVAAMVETTPGHIGSLIIVRRDGKRLKSCVLEAMMLCADKKVREAALSGMDHTAGGRWIIDSVTPATFRVWYNEILDHHGKYQMEDLDIVEN